MTVLCRHAILKKRVNAVDRFAYVLLRSAAPAPKPCTVEGSTQTKGANKENLGNDPYTICEGCRTLISRHLRGASE